MARKLKSPPVRRFLTDLLALTLLLFGGLCMASPAFASRGVSSWVVPGGGGAIERAAMVVDEEEVFPWCIFCQGTCSDSYGWCPCCVCKPATLAWKCQK